MYPLAPVPLIIHPPRFPPGARVVVRDLSATVLEVQGYTRDGEAVCLTPDGEAYALDPAALDYVH